MAEVKRLNYFNSQFLVERDFLDEQSYHIMMRRLHNRALRSWGIVNGLNVVKSGDREVSISPGLAVDSAGREIVVLSTQTHIFAATAANVALYLTLAYQDFRAPSDLDNSGGVSDHTRITERPLVTASPDLPPNDGSVITLARVTLDAAGNVQPAIDNSFRRMSLITPGGDFEARSLKLTDPSVDRAGWPRLRVSAANQAALEGASLRLDEARELLFQGNAQIRAGDNNHRLVIDRTTNRLELHELGEISFHTGSPAPAERMRLLANGTLGIGTSTPDTSTRLDVAGTVAAQYLRMNATDATNEGGEIQLKGAGANPDWHIDVSGDRFRLHSGTEKFVVDTSGRVGIGVSQPNRLLHVSGAGSDANGYADLRITGTGALASGITLEATGAGGRTYSWLSTANGAGSGGGRLGLYDVTAKAYRMVVDASGNVGIGTTAPAASTKLDVAGTVAAQYLRMNATDATNEGGEIQIKGAGTNPDWHIDVYGDRFRLHSGTEKFVVDTTGRVGIGVSQPSRLLHISGPGSDAGGSADLRVTGTGAASGITLEATGPGGHTYSWLSTANGAGSGGGKLGLYDVTSRGYRMVVDANGYVGIGTTQPAVRLDVSGGDIKWGNNSYLSADQGGSIELGGDSANAGTGKPYIDFHQAGLVQDYNVRLQNDANGRFSVFASTIYTAGRIGIGTTKPVKGLHVQGAYSAPMLEDDYARPAIALTGDYPEITIFSGVANGWHGPTLRLGAYDNATAKTTFKHWVVGTAGQDANFLDFGFATNNSNPHAGIRGWNGRTVMTLLENGNVGIGRTDPTAVLHVKGNANILNLEGTDHCYIQWFPDGTNVGRRAWIGYGSPNDNGLTINSDMPGAAININGQERIYLLSKDGTYVSKAWSGNGNLIVEGELFLGSSRTNIGGFDGRPGFHWFRTTGGGENSMWMGFLQNEYARPSAIEFGVRYYLGSDARLKTNIEKVSGVLDKLEKIQGVSFELVNQGSNQRSIGVIAQEVETVFPELVSAEGAKGYKSVDYNGLIGVLVEASKELKAENRALKSRLESLENALHSSGERRTASAQQQA